MPCLPAVYHHSIAAGCCVEQHRLHHGARCRAAHACTSTRPPTHAHQHVPAAAGVGHVSGTAEADSSLTASGHRRRGTDDLPLRATAAATAGRKYTRRGQIISDGCLCSGSGAGCSFTWPWDGLQCNLLHPQRTGSCPHPHQESPLQTPLQKPSPALPRRGCRGPDPSQSVRTARP